MPTVLFFIQCMKQLQSAVIRYNQRSEQLIKSSYFYFAVEGKKVNCRFKTGLQTHTLPVFSFITIYIQKNDKLKAKPK